MAREMKRDCCLSQPKDHAIKGHPRYLSIIQHPKIETTEEFSNG